MGTAATAGTPPKTENTAGNVKEAYERTSSVGTANVRNVWDEKL